MRWHSTCVMVLLGACGGPPIASKVPRANPTYVAAAAAATALALTAADPDQAGKRPERPGDEPMRGSDVPTEMVPESVLDRADAVPRGKRPCAPAPAPPAPKPADPLHVDLFPDPTRTHRGDASAPRGGAPCEDDAPSLPDADPK